MLIPSGIIVLPSLPSFIHSFLIKGTKTQKSLTPSVSIDKSDDISPLLTWNHFCSAIKLFFESCCNVVENRQFPPASAQRARSRQSVTFAFGAHKVLDCLFDIGKWLRLESFFFPSKRAINDCERLIYLPVFLPRCCAA